jgi:hypothetical protein
MKKLPGTWQPGWGNRALMEQSQEQAVSHGERCSSSHCPCFKAGQAYATEQAAMRAALAAHEKRCICGGRSIPDSDCKADHPDGQFPNLLGNIG